MNYEDLKNISKAAVKAIEEDRWRDAHILAKKVVELQDEWNEAHPAYEEKYLPY